jgi:hypothetical protein
MGLGWGPGLHTHTRARVHAVSPSQPLSLPMPPVVKCQPVKSSEREESSERCIPEVCMIDKQFGSEWKRSCMLHRRWCRASVGNATLVSRTPCPPLLSFLMMADPPLQDWALAVGFPKMIHGSGVCGPWVPYFKPCRKARPKIRCRRATA